MDKSIFIGTGAWNPDRYYVGPSLVSQRILSLVPFGKLLNRAGYVHDCYYAKGGDSKKREEADVEFTKIGLDSIRECNRGMIYKYLAYKTLFIYFRLLRIFGALFMKHGNN